MAGQNERVPGISREGLKAYHATLPVNGNCREPNLKRRIESGPYLLRLLAALRR